MSMQKFMVMFGILMVDKVCIVILTSSLTANTSTAYTFTNLRSHAMDVPSKSGFEHMTTHKQDRRITPGVKLHFSLGYKFTLSEYAINKKKMCRSGNLY
jgi:hypothetical protein